MRKLCGRGHLTNAAKNKIPNDFCSNRDPTEFARQFLTMNDTLVHHYTPETKPQSKQCGGGGSRQFNAKESKVNLICREDHYQLVLGLERNPVN
ncbi:hypothetical protein TNIN_120451 [Trichonephila inaurata madagascariensis]|uniref:Uncharacterized protein n=1 Tax=Trichonephila inaurata madagascariensis TaxID=2747483 RepID=A0A8X6YJ80_9ARAC|nr:hypothetical protein TNIN_120451 [Trichonephila inaurata madagascariensis]